MPSKNERQRWSDAFDAAIERNQRQRQAITRLTLLVTETAAALYEIRDGDLVESGMRERARRALEAIEEPAAAVQQSVEELDSEEDPNPRRKQ